MAPRTHVIVEGVRLSREAIEKAVEELNAPEPLHLRAVKNDHRDLRGIILERGGVLTEYLKGAGITWGDATIVDETGNAISFFKKNGLPPAWEFVE